MFLLFLSFKLFFQVTLTLAAAFGLGPVFAEIGSYIILIQVIAGNDKYLGIYLYQYRKQ